MYWNRVGANRIYDKISVWRQYAFSVNYRSILREWTVKSESKREISFYRMWTRLLSCITIRFGIVYLAYTMPHAHILSQHFTPSFVSISIFVNFEPVSMTMKETHRNAEYRVFGAKESWIFNHFLYIRMKLFSFVFRRSTMFYSTYCINVATDEPIRMQQIEILTQASYLHITLLVYFKWLPCLHTNTHRTNGTFILKFKKRKNKILLKSSMVKAKTRAQFHG